MNTIKGALSVLLFEGAFWLLPPDHDPTFMALSLPLQVFIISALGVLMLTATFIFFTSVENEFKQ
jgi:hypothetical protein